MKILFVQKRFHPNQVFTVKSLIDCGHSVRYLVQETGSSEDHHVLTPKVVPYSRLFIAIDRIFFNGRVDRLRYGMPSVPFLYKQISDFQPDVVVLKKLRSFSLVASLLCSLQKKPKVLYHQRPLHRKRRLSSVSWILARLGLIPKFSYTPVLGPGPEKMQRGNGVTEFYLPFVLDAKSYSLRSWPSNPDSKYRVKILTVGKFESKRKNHALLLNAFAALRANHEIALTMVGAGSERGANFLSLKELVNRLGLESAVEFKVNVRSQAMKSLYSEFDLFVLPSSDEPAAFSILEAMASGLPVICSDSNGTKCYVKEGENGLVFKSDDLGDLIRSIRKIISRPEVMPAMGAVSRELVLNNHSPQRICESFDSIVRKVK